MAGAPHVRNASGRARRSVGLLASAAFIAAAWPLPALAQKALPTGGTVASGSASIATGGTSVLVTQSSRNAIINWQGFSIGQGNSVRFENGAGATLNRVTGFSRSQIDGSLSASGSLYLVNPNGVTVGPSGTVSIRRLHPRHFGRRLQCRRRSAVPRRQHRQRHQLRHHRFAGRRCGPHRPQGREYRHHHRAGRHGGPCRRL
ncbi:filamentous hemagglutinin N-terminal domain-containing protein [Xanthobacteraceae bacterium A53D]